MVPAVGKSLLHERKEIAMPEGSCGNSRVVIWGFEFLPDEEAGVRGDFVLSLDEGYTLRELFSSLEEVARRVNSLYEFGKPDDKPKKYRLECHGPEGADFNITFRKNLEAWDCTIDGNIESFDSNTLQVINQIQRIYEKLFLI
jgi:hypothetical protein